MSITTHAITTAIGDLRINARNSTVTAANARLYSEIGREYRDATKRDTLTQARERLAPEHTALALDSYHAKWDGGLDQEEAARLEVLGAILEELDFRIGP